ncbi:MAG: class II glutamine amidotransferase [Melioribacter sp.]|nr:class II glutamine amidotransferase [Melioribacter sp.]
MCRLLYVNSVNEFDIDVYLSKFANISRNSKEFQGHGWGCAYLKDGAWSFYKNIKPIWEDNLKQFGSTKRLLAHARSAFRDEGIVVENNMPFYDDKYIFIFNGELRGVKIKEEGRIGAEKIFNYIKRFDKGNIKDAIKKGTEIIIKKTNYIRAMNFIIADENSAYVFSFYNEDPDYFTMYMKNYGDKILICSDKFADESDWHPIPNNSLLEFKCI